MIKLTQLNDVGFVVNCRQIETIQSIPESKVILQNKTFYIVKESPDEIISKVVEFYAVIDRLGKQNVTK